MGRAAIELKTRDEIARMREAGAIVGEVLEAVGRAALPGVTTAELDGLAEELAIRRGARPAFKGYLHFPHSLCASLNEEVVHGLPSRRRRLADGDLLKVDFGVRFRGFYADAAITLAVGRPSKQAQRLAQAAGECLRRGIAQLVPGKRVSDIGAAVQEHAQACGFSVVRDFVGHGIGRALHEPPPVPNYPGGVRPDPELRPGMVLAVEPMVNAGRAETEVLADRWTAVTRDRSLSAHFEHTVAVTEGGPEVLTGP